MKEIENRIKEAFNQTQEPLPSGHRERFLAKLQAQQAQGGEKTRGSKTRRVFVFGAVAASVAAVVMVGMLLLRPAAHTLSEQEQILQQRVAVIEENLVELEAMHSRILVMAKEKLDTKDFAEVQQNLNGMRAGYLELFELAATIPQKEFEKTLRAAMHGNGFVYT